MVRRDSDSCKMEVTYFGFDEDLSDLTCCIVMTMDIPAVRICDESEISSLGDDPRSYLDDYYSENKNELKFDDIVSVRAEGDAHLTVISDPGMYTGDYMMQETDTVGFQFVFEPDASWSFALNGSPFDMPKVGYMCSGVWEESSDEDYDAEILYYRTMSIILADSDLVERESTVVDEWKAKTGEKEKKEDKKDKESEPSEKTEKQGTGTLSTVLLIAGAVCAAAAAFIFLRSKR